MIKIGPTEENILREITESIGDELNKVGIFNRVFSRIKTTNSIEKKLDDKRQSYTINNKKMQDIFGIRVTLYFLDDEKIAVNLISKIFEEVPDSHSIDTIDKDRFGPIRNNLVFRVPENHITTSSLFDQEFIDSTFEVQFRTVFSEGWHEVEHDLRYKCKTDWENENSLSRHLNGQLATLETCDWAMLKIFDEFAYKKYKAKEWGAFFRNALRIRFEDGIFTETIIAFLDENPLLLKDILKSSREDIIISLTNLTTKIPLKMDNVLFIVNRGLIKNKTLMTFENTVLRNILDESFS